MNYFNALMLFTGFFAHYVLTLEQIHSNKHQFSNFYINLFLNLLNSTLIAIITFLLFYAVALHLAYFHKELESSYGLFVNIDYKSEIFLNTFIKENLFFVLSSVLVFAVFSFTSVMKADGDADFPIFIKHLLLYLSSLLVFAVILKFNLLNMTLTLNECNNGIISFEKNTIISEKLFGKDNYIMAFCTKLD